MVAPFTGPGPDAKSTGAHLPARASFGSQETAPNISLIHVADLAACFTLAAELGPSGSIVSVVDSEPTTYRELFTYVARLEGGAVPTGGGVSNFSSFRVANSKAQEILGWRPFYRSYRSGLI